MKKINTSLILKVLAIIAIKDLIESFGDLFFKMGALSTQINNIYLSNLFEFASRITSSQWLWLGVLFYLVNFFIWVALLSRLDLSVLFPMSSLTYIFVPIMAAVYLHENVSLIRWAGIIMIIAGVTLISKAAAKEEVGLNGS